MSLTKKNHRHEKSVLKRVEHVTQNFLHAKENKNCSHLEVT